MSDDSTLSRYKILERLGSPTRRRLALKIPANHEEPSETYPFTPVAEHTLGLAALKKGSNADAVKLLEVAARLRPDRDSIRQDLERARRNAK